MSVTAAPKYSIHRNGITAADGAASTNERDGESFAGYDLGIVQIIPSGGANPTVELMVWSEAAGKFISANPAASKTGLGADTPYEFTFTAAGRKFWVMVTALAAGSVDVYVAGHRTASV